MSGNQGQRQFEWTDLKYFLELSRAGNPTAAARRLHVDHNTVRRRVMALETALQTHLFLQGGTTYELTPEGDCLLKYAEAIEALAMRAEEALVTSGLEISGTVRVAAPNCFGSYFLARKLAELSMVHPDLRLKAVVLPQIVNLSKREADVAILPARPGQLRQIVRKITDYTMRIYAADEYLQKAPPLRNIKDLSDHQFVGYIPDMLDTPNLDFLPHVARGVEARFESASISAQIEATAAGAGLCVLPDFIAAEHPGIRVVLADDFKLVGEYWIAMHPEMSNLARVRVVIDFIVESVRKEAARFCVGTNEKAFRSCAGAPA